MFEGRTVADADVMAAEAMHFLVGEVDAVRQPGRAGVSQPHSSR